MGGKSFQRSLRLVAAPHTVLDTQTWGPKTLKNERESERRVFYFLEDGRKRSIAGLVDDQSDPLDVLVRRRTETVRIPRRLLDYIWPPAPDGVNA